jgi:hypothetical protein
MLQRARNCASLLVEAKGDITAQIIRTNGGAITLSAGGNINTEFISSSSSSSSSGTAGNGGAITLSASFVLT